VVQPEVWSQAWERLPAGVLMLRDDLTVAYANPAAARIAGCAPAELLDRPYSAALPAHLETGAEAGVRAVLDGAQSAAWEALYPAGTYDMYAYRVGGQVVVVGWNVDSSRAAAEELEALLSRTELLLALSSELSRDATTGDICGTVIDIAATHLGTAYAGVHLLDPDRERVLTMARGQIDPDVEAVWQELPLSHTGAAPVVIRTQQAEFHETFEAVCAAHPDSRDRYEAAGLRAGAILPLLRQGGRAFGAMTLAWSTEHPMDEGERATITALAGYTAQAIQRVQLQEEQLGVAETLQRALLTELPQPDHLQLAARYLPAHTGAQVGGDWYDALQLPDGATALAIGDVSGHDMAAAASMGQLRSILRGYAFAFADQPSVILQRLDEAIDGLRMGVVATASLGRLEQTEELRARGLRQLRWSNAGHPPPLLLRPDGSVEVLATPPELLLGLDATTARTDHVVELPVGSTLVLYTDGLIERRESDLARGLADLETALAGAGAAELPLEDLLDTLIKEVVGCQPEDDVAVLAVRLHPQDRPRPAEAGPVTR
jgi:serine phosphatase RsbU (regulator of sigma subunit)